MPGIGPYPPPRRIGAPLFKPPGSSNISLPIDPRYVYSGPAGYVLRTTAGPSARPLTLDEAIQQQQRENAARAWAAWEHRKRRREAEAWHRQQQENAARAARLENKKRRTEKTTPSRLRLWDPEKKNSVTRAMLVLLYLSALGKMARQLEEERFKSIE